MKILRGPRQRIYDIAFSPDGALLASSAQDAVRLWDTISGDARIVQKSVFTAHPPFNTFVMPCGRVAFTGDGLHLVARSFEGGLQVWPLSEPGKVNSLLTLRRMPLIELCRWALAVSSSSNVIAANVPDSDTDHMMIRLYDQSNWQERGLSLTDGSNPLSGLAFDPAGSRLATNFGIFGVESGEHLLAVPFSGDRLQWSPDGRHIAGYGSGNVVWVYDAGTGELTRTVQLERKHVQGFAFSPDGAYLAVVSNEEVVRVWETRTWTEREGFAWKVGKLKCVAFAPDGQRAACASDRGVIVIWDWDI